MADRIEREIVLPSSPERVWREITDADALSGWLADQVQLDLVAGGEARFRDGGDVREGWVEEVSAPDPDAAPGSVAGRLAFWWSEGDEPATRVELTLTPLAEELTRLRVVETRPLELLHLVGIPLPGAGGRTYGPALIAA
jgi:uncharacterized protein YndB with AHSA1/START domain